MSSNSNQVRQESRNSVAINMSQSSGDTQRPKTAKPLAPKLKVVIRRLPPSLTKERFMAILGSEWELGKGKVDWMLFKPGKISRDPSKPSRPSRAYLHLTNESNLINLSEIVRKSNFDDAQSSLRNQCLIGPPTIEYALFGYIPSNRTRSDARAGTIDQDPEFMKFLERLANPTKEHNTEASGALCSKLEKITTTPLVQYLRDKKASKNKDAAAKAVKKQEIQTTKNKNLMKDSKPNLDDAKKSKDNKTERLTGKISKESVRIVNKESTQVLTPVKQNNPISDKISPKPDIAKLPPARQKGAAIATHIRMLQRDLGIVSNQSNRPVKHETANTLKPEKAGVVEMSNSITNGAEPEPIQTQKIPTAPRAKLNAHNNRRGRGKCHTIESESTHLVGASSKIQPPVVLLKKSESTRKDKVSNIPDPATARTKTKSTGSLRKTQANTLSTEGAVQAFVKYVSLSQGITESLLKEAMKNFGEVSRVEIDKRKSFAYVSFNDMEALNKAMAASPIPVAQGAVQVMPRKGHSLNLEKKMIPPAPSRNGRGGRGGSNGRRAARAALKANMNSPPITGSSENTKQHVPSSPRGQEEK